MLGGWQGTFCAGISTHNIERGGRLCYKRTLFSYFVQSVLSLIVGVATNTVYIIIQSLYKWTKNSQVCTFPNLQSGPGRLAEFGCVFIFYCTFLPFRDFAVLSPDKSELADAAAVYMRI